MLYLNHNYHDHWTDSNCKSHSLLRCSSCWTVRSREVRLSLTGMVAVGPLKFRFKNYFIAFKYFLDLQPRGVARAPFSLMTTSLSSIFFTSPVDI